MGASRSPNFSNSGPWFAGLFVVALVAFWPTYISQSPRTSTVYTHLVLAILIWLERHGSSGRRVFPVMLALFVVAQLPALLLLTEMRLWQSFAAWFAALPLT